MGPAPRVVSYTHQLSFLSSSPLEVGTVGTRTARPQHPPNACNMNMGLRPCSALPDTSVTLVESPSLWCLGFLTYQVGTTVPPMA